MPDKRQRGRWEDIPPGRPLTLREAAAIMGIERKSLINYTAEHPRRRLPDGFRVIRDSPKVILLVRDR